MATNKTNSEVHVVALQTVTPAKMTEAGQRRGLKVVDIPMTREVLQSRFEVVWYYNKGSEEVEVDIIGAWIKESLSVALVEKALLAGRLRRGDEGNWELKLNDCGVRLVQATTEMSLEDCKQKHLAYWMDIDIHNPHFSALFYIQVTKFKGDDYSIGISCSLLLADPLLFTRFLKLWSEIHHRMLLQGQLSKSPMFHLGYFQTPENPHYLHSIELKSDSINSNSTTFFKINRSTSSSYAVLGSACVEEATKGIKGELDTSKFCAIINEPEYVQIEPCPKSGSTQTNCKLNLGSWHDFGIEDMSFVEGNKPTFVTYNVVSNIEGLVVVMASSDERDGEELMISVTMPKV